MAGMGIYRKLNRAPLVSSYRGKFVVAVLAGALLAPAGVGLWALLTGGVGFGVLVLVLFLGLAGAALTAFLVHGLLVPVERAAAAAAAALEGRAPPAVADTGTDLAGRLLADVTRLAHGGPASRGDTALAPVTDPLTGLRNRHWCETRLAGELVNDKEDCVLALIDVNQLQRINDEHGHVVGDACLQNVARATRETLRTGDRLARWGGDEFLALLRGGREEAEAALERLRTRVTQIRVADGGAADVRISVTIGAVACRGGEPVDALVRAADSAVADARKRRGGRVAFYGD